MTGDPRIPEVRAQVTALRPVDAREARSREVILDALDRLPRPFDEHADTTHVTTSALVVGPRGVLLHLHRRLRVWLQPGGHVDTGERPADAVVREVHEETGLWCPHRDDPPRIVHVDVHAGGRGHTHLDLRYVLDGPDAEPCPPPDESQQVAWFGPSAATTVADPGLAGLLRSIRRSPTRPE